METTILGAVAYLQQLADGGAAWAVWVVFSLSVLGGLSVTASAVIAATPSKHDDKWLEEAKAGKLGFLFRALDSLSMIRKK